MGGIFKISNSGKNNHSNAKNVLFLVGWFLVLGGRIFFILKVLFRLGWCTCNFMVDNKTFEAGDLPVDFDAGTQWS